MQICAISRFAVRYHHSPIFYLFLKKRRQRVFSVCRSSRNASPSALARSVTGLRFQESVHLHIQHPSVFKGVAPQRALARESALFQDSAGSGVSGKRLRKEPNNVRVLKHVFANLLYGACSDSPPPIRLGDIISYFRRFGVDKAPFFRL